MPANQGRLNLMPSPFKNSIPARIEAMEAAATARRTGNVDLANRLRGIAGYRANELDYVDGWLARLP